MAGDTLDTLVRLAGRSVDNARRALQVLLAEEDRINADYAALAERIESESEMVRAKPEFGSQFGSFMVWAKDRREKLDAEMRELVPKIDTVRDALADAFAEQKKYEIAKQNRDEAEAADEKRKEGIAMDEMGLNAFRRKDGA
ncbi:flagellar export protein FliJ [Rhodospirillaceae bacterium KN72]|uniref:Flagellar FliJ protein n=1 Tax=Pacificispira spongiicola TaxID=2729598 RepID=A0A7Y0E338_9PROT|nr:flagellar export protein FliJ [Pacificispira spongiicola]NMM46365.1 flagellar export protein FliJ [Pacificispira spongiicola]